MSRTIGASSRFSATPDKQPTKGGALLTANTGMGLRSGSPTCKQDVHKQRVASLPAFFFPLNFGEDRALRAASHSLLIPSLTRWCSIWVHSPLSTILSSIKVPPLHEAFFAPSISARRPRTLLSFWKSGVQLICPADDFGHDVYI